MLRPLHPGQLAGGTDQLGAGLGLSIVQGLAEANDGSVEYERRHGRSRFVLHLPVADADADASAPEPHLASPASRQP